MSGLSLTPIDGKEVGELSEVSPEALRDIDKEGVQYEITVLEEKLAQMKPNMAAIAEYRKKVGHISTIPGTYWLVQNVRFGGIVFYMQVGINAYIPSVCIMLL